MKTFLKWFAGILLGLLTLLIAAAAFFAVRGYFLYGVAYRVGGHMFPGRDFDIPMMRSEYYHMTPFGVWGGILAFLMPVALLALVVIGVVLIVRAFQRPAAQPVATAAAVMPAVTAPVMAGPAVVAAPETAAAPEAARVCSHCGRAADTDWKVCPYCTEPLD